MAILDGASREENARNRQMIEQQMNRAIQQRMAAQTNAEQQRAIDQTKGLAMHIDGTYTPLIDVINQLRAEVESLKGGK